MSVALRRQRDGNLRRFWYAEYVDPSTGKRTVENTNIKWDGTPPPSLLGTGDSTTGSTDFETSRKAAEEWLETQLIEKQYKGRAEHLTERLIESKTGRKVEYTRIADLATRWRNLGREAEVTEAHFTNCDAHFRRFVNFMNARKKPPEYLYQVTPEDAAGFVKDLRNSKDKEHGQLAPATVQYGVRLIAKAMGRFLPVGSVSPFSEFVGKRKSGESGVVHREPFTPDELRALLDTAREDAFMYPLIVTAACSGMRRGDVCELKWADVDLASGMLKVKTSKTGGNVEIPIFDPLRAVLEARGGKRRGSVFPEAAAMLKANPDGLTYRFKSLVARALDSKRAPSPPEIVPAAEIGVEGAAAIAEHVAEGKRRDRLLDTLQRYCAGASVRQIEKVTGCARATVATDLQSVETWTGKKFMRRTPGRHTKGKTSGLKSAIARVTRVTRETGKGQRAASTRDWHALRTTFVTLALTAGVPIELVRRVTGHATVEVVLKHYFRPDREQFRAALTGALPDVLTGGPAAPKQLTEAESTANELDALYGKVKAGTATKEEKKLFRKLSNL